MLYELTTENVRVSVRPFYAEERSEPEANRFVFGYKVVIENRGEVPVQLTRRLWRITDGLGRTVVVEGKGVVGEQPRLDPGEAFEYVSGAPLPTPTGTMEGHYRMVRPDGSGFDAVIPGFSLDLPDARPARH